MCTQSQKFQPKAYSNLTKSRQTLKGTALTWEVVDVNDVVQALASRRLLLWADEVKIKQLQPQPPAQYVRLEGGRAADCVRLFMCEFICVFVGLNS
jgi:hypothetical protein